MKEQPLRAARSAREGTAGDDETGIKANDDGGAKALDKVNYIMHMTGGRQYKKQSAGDGGMPPLN